MLDGGQNTKINMEITQKELSDQYIYNWVNFSPTGLNSMYSMPFEVKFCK